MKNKTIIIIVLISLGVFILFGVLAGIGFARVASVPGGFSYNIDGNGIAYSENEHSDLTDVDVIDITVVSSDVTFTESESGLDAVLDMRAWSEKEKLTLSVEKAADTLYIEVEHPAVSISTVWSSLSLALPKDFDGEIIVHSTSGDVRGNMTNSLDGLAVRTVSGDTDLSFKSVDNVKLGSTSGTFRIDSNIKELEADSTSGEIVVQNLVSSDAKASVKTVSGRVSLSYVNACETTVNTTSGDVQISVPQNTPLKVLFSSASGNMHGDVNINKDGVLFDVKTVSGDLSFD